MNIDLTPEQEQIVDKALRSGRFCTTEEVITEALQSLREKDRSASITEGSGDSTEAVGQMFSFIEENSICLKGVLVKQLIHEDYRPNESE